MIQQWYLTKDRSLVGECQYCGQRVRCVYTPDERSHLPPITHVDERFPKGAESRTYHVRECVGCGGQFRVTGTAGAIPHSPDAGLVISSWLNEQLRPQSSGYDYRELPLVTAELISLAKLTTADSVREAMRSLALEVIKHPESIAELRDLVTGLSQQHPDASPLTANVLTAFSDCASEGRTAPAVHIEDAVGRLLTADQATGALCELAVMTPESLAKLRHSLIALDLLDLPALPVANLLEALIRSKSG